MSPAQLSQPGPELTCERPSGSSPATCPPESGALKAPETIALRAAINPRKALLIGAPSMGRALSLSFGAALRRCSGQLTPFGRSLLLVSRTEIAAIIRERERAVAAAATTWTLYVFARAQAICAARARVCSLERNRLSAQSVQLSCVVQESYVLRAFKAVQSCERERSHKRHREQASEQGNALIGVVEVNNVCAQLRDLYTHLNCSLRQRPMCVRVCSILVGLGRSALRCAAFSARVPVIYGGQTVRRLSAGSAAF